MPELSFQEINRFVPISHEAYDKIFLYRELLIKWQKRVNLIGPETIGDIWRRHIVDSLQLRDLIDNDRAVTADLGSGAGFPGMVLAIAGMRYMHLIESDEKKCIFLHEVARQTQTPVTIHRERIERLPPFHVDIVTARACASLSQLLFWAENFLSPNTICLFPKGKNHAKEIGEARKFFLFEHAVFPSVIDQQGVILKLTGIRRKV